MPAKLARILKLVLLLLLVCLAFAPAGAQGIGDRGVVLTFPGNEFHLDVPLGEPGRLTVQLLDTEDTVRSTAATDCPGAGVCHVDLPPARARVAGVFEANDLPLYRVRLSLVRPGLGPVETTLAVAHIAPSLFELHLAASHTIRPGAAAEVRLRAVHPLTGEPRAGVTLLATASADFADKRDDAVFARQTLRTDAAGFAAFRFTGPASGQLNSVEATVTGSLANLKLDESVTLNAEGRARLQLTTDKPLYQPGQTLHTRLLALDRTGRAEAGRSMTFEIRDPDSTLLFRTEATTSKFGIATADWQIPGRLRLGGYHITAKPDGGSETEIAVRVSQYDLPTFTVTPRPDHPFYLPGQDADVLVHADYLFGKPVLHGHVRVVREDERQWNAATQTYDSKETPAVEGDLDAKGEFHAHLPLGKDEAEYAGTDPGNEYTDVHFAAYLTDSSTNRTEPRKFDLRVTRQALHLYVVGGRDLAAGLPQRLFLAVTQADGTPAARSVVNLALVPAAAPSRPGFAAETLEQRLQRASALPPVTTDARGLVELDLPTWESMQPGSDGASDGPSLYLAARDAEGRTGALEQDLPQPDEALRVTASRVLLRPGEAITVTVESAVPDLAVTLEALRSTSLGDVLLASRDAVLRDGKAAITLPTDARFTGEITLVAVALRPLAGDAERHGGEEDAGPEPIVSASAAVLFPRDNSLHVALTMDKPLYRAGEQATATVAVAGPRDPDGDDRHAGPVAVGLEVVDQAVDERNRTDTDFGGRDAGFFFGSFWTLYSNAPAGGVTLEQLNQLAPGKPFPPDLELPARMLLAAQRVDLSVGSNAPASAYATVFSNFFAKQLFDVRKTLHDYLETHPEPPTDEPGLAALLAAHGVDLHALRDPWGMPYSVTLSPPLYGRVSLQLRSAGPDKVPGTADDFTVDIATWNWFAVHLKQIDAALRTFHEHTHGFIRDQPTLLAELRREGLEPEGWSSPEGRPIAYDFEVEGSRFAVSASSSSPAGRGRHRYDQTYTLGSASLEYFADDRLRLQRLLNAWSARHPFPSTQAELDEALAANGLTLRDFRDAWNNPVYALFSHRSTFADRTETVAGPGTAAHTVITPVTRVLEMIQIRSHGPQPDPDRSVSIPLATLTHIRSEQSAAEQTAHRPGSGTVRPGRDGGVTGVVSDASGAVVPGAIAVLTDAAGFRQEALTDGQGRYRLDPVPPGTYKLQVSAQGFVLFRYTDIRLTAGSAVEVDVTLQAGGVEETVEVSAAEILLETSSASLGGVVDGNTVRDLAVNGRNYLNLLGFLPGSVGKGEPTATPRLRDYFPETLLWRPEMITAPNGTATIRFPVADSLTRWQLSASASTLGGNTGGAVTGFASFQPFFAAFDPPPVLTVGDSLALPVALRNYTGKPLEVKATLTPAPWFRVDAAPAMTAVPAQDSASPVVRFTAIAPVADGKQEFTATAGREGDRIARPVSVHPDGHEVAATAATLIVPGANTLELMLPDGALPGGNSAELKVYPNLAAHLHEALAGLLAEPHGCAEQIVSAAWPSLLLEQYAARLPGSAPAKGPGTRHFLEEAYANLLPEQRADGGFGYWSDSPHADPALTAYVIRFLSAAGELVTVDPGVIEHAIAYLATQQAGDGRWLTPDREGKPDPDATRANAMLTASIAANLASVHGSAAGAGLQIKAAPLLRKALDGLTPFVGEFDEPYTLASYALAALALNDRTDAAGAVARLRALAQTENGGAYWALETNTPFYGAGRAGRVEASAQVLRALLAAGDTPQNDLVARGFLFLNHQQDRDGLWYSSQATARALDVLAAIALRTPVTNANPAALSVQVDGGTTRPVPLPPSSRDGGPVLIPLGAALGAGAHRVSLTLPAGSSAATAQVVARSYIPWPATAAAPVVSNHEQLRFTVAYSSGTAEPGDAMTVAVHAERIGFRGYGMLLAEIGLPPGAEVDRATLETALTASNFQLNRYEVRPDRVVLYLDPRAGGVDLRFAFRLRYRIDALTAPSTMYDFYNPDAHVDLRPTRFVSPQLQ